MPAKPARVAGPPSLDDIGTGGKWQGKPTAVEIRAAAEILDRAGMDFIGTDDKPEEMHITVSFLGPKGKQNAKQALNQPEKIS
jgi:hypothetical protein